MRMIFYDYVSWLKLRWILTLPHSQIQGWTHDQPPTLRRNPKFYIHVYVNNFAQYFSNVIAP